MKKYKIINFTPWVLAVWPYLFFACFLCSYINGDLASVLLLAYIIATPVVYITNIVYACFLKGEKSCKKLALYDMVLKLIHIPFYGIVFLAGLLLFGTIVVPALIFVTPTIILILFFVDVCLMVTTSMYGVSALVQAARKKEVSKLYACIHVILHFLFVTDVVSAFWVYIKIRKSARKKSAEM